MTAMEPDAMRLLAIPLIATLFVSSAAAGKPAPEQVSQRLLDELVAVNGVPGMGAAVWHRGRIVWRGSSGYRNLERKQPVDERTIFRLASVSKLIAATAAAKLHEEGKLDVDAPVTTILPWLRNGWQPINARQLAAHISGLPHYQEQDAGRGAVRYPDSRSAVALFQDRPLLTPPGQAYSYSSWGYTLLGALVEQGSGFPFTDYVRRRVTPGLEIGPDKTGGSDPNASVAYEFKSGKPVPAAPHDFSYTWGGGGLGATPAALAMFGGSMLRNRVVARETFDWMLQPARLADGREVANDDYKVGFGWRTGVDEDGAAIAHHNGITVGARSALVLWRGEEMAASLLSNALWTSSIDRAARMIAAPHRPFPGGLTAAACPVSATRYSGTFGGQPVAGTARFMVEDGLCVGTIAAAGELAAWLSRGEERRAGNLRLVSLDGQGGLGRAGFVTPYGIYDWRASADGSFRTPFGGPRELVLRLS